MSEHNPFSPPVAPVADTAPIENIERYPSVQRLIFSGLILLQAYAFWSFAPVYFVLVKAGGVGGLPFLTTMIGILFLYIGGVFIFLKRPRGAVPLGIAVVAFSVSVPLWGWIYVGAGLAGLSALLAAFGIYVVRRSGRVSLAQATTG
jgi:hypothetical protein